MNKIFIVLPILILLLFFNNVEGFNSDEFFDYEDQTQENILQSDNWCSCDNTCNLADVNDAPDPDARWALGKSSKTAGTAGVKDLNDTCDINYNFVKGVTKSDNKQNDLVDYCDGCLDIMNIKCRPNNFSKNSGKDPIQQLDTWCRGAGGRVVTGAGVLNRCEGSTEAWLDSPRDMIVEKMGYGFGPHQILPCPANQNPFQRWKRLGNRWGPRGRYGSNIHYGMLDNID